MSSDASKHPPVVRQLKAELGRLGLGEKAFAPDEEAPPLDLAKLEQLARRRLPDTQAHLLLRLVARYRDWYHAYLDLLIKVANESGAEDK